MPVITPDALRALAREVLERCGAPSAYATTAADHLVESNLAGHDSHGVMRLPQYVAAIRKKSIIPDAAPELLSHTGSGCVVSGHWGFGQVAAMFAMEHILRVARESALGCAVLRESNHIGRLGAYAEMAAREGMAGLIMANGHGAAALMAPFGGIDPRLCSNPIAFGAPRTDGPPILLDTSMSAMAEGSVRVRLRRGEQLPPGCVVDAEGNPTTDPAALYGPPPGSLLPFGGPIGHKAYGLAVMVECLAGALSGAGCTSDDAPRGGNAAFVLVIDIGAFTSPAAFEQETGHLAEWLKSSRPTPGGGEILVPGEPEARAREQRSRDGIPIDDETWGELQRVTGELGVEGLGAN